MSPAVSGRVRFAWIHWFLPPLLSALFATLWLWPITLAGRRPSGGEITSFSLPRMAAYGRALQRGRLPLWNEKLGLGSSFLAAGEVGVFYPPHWLLYGCLDPQDAFAASMLVHFTLAAWFGYLCARSVGLTQVAAGLSALVFAGQGFFTGHLSQSWSYTTGCWVPLAMAGTWGWIRRGELRWLAALIGALSMQLLAAHFQLAVYTLVMVFLSGGWGSCLAAAGRPSRRAQAQSWGAGTAGPRAGWRGLGARAWRGCVVLCRSLTLRRALLLPIAVAAALGIAAIQLLPALELAQIAAVWQPAATDPGSFSRPPWHLVGELAPSLLRNPLWEPAVWSPWRSSYKECLSYVGLLPLGLAGWALIGGRREGTVRMWGGLLLVSGLLSWGEFVPGLNALLALPGCGWLSAPARWSIMSGLCLAILAGRGLERMDFRRFAGWCRSYLAVVLVTITVGVGVVCGMLLALESFAMTHLQGLKLLTYGYGPAHLNEITPAGQMWQILRAELTLPAINLVVLLLVSLVPQLVNNPRRLVSLVLIWTLVDLFANAELVGGVDFDLAAPFAERSRVLELVGSQAPHRVAGAVGDRTALVEVAGIGPEHRPWALNADDIEWLRLTDARLVLVGLGAFEARFRDQKLRQLAVPGAPPAGLKTLPPISDLWLSADVWGQGVLKLDATAAAWAAWQVPANVSTSRAWVFPISEDTGMDPRSLTGPPAANRRMLDRATAVQEVVDEGETIAIEGYAQSAAVLVLSDLHYPGWEATLTQFGKTQPVPIEPAFGRLRAVAIPNAGPYKVSFEFRSRPFRLGWRVSLTAFLASVLGLAAIAARRRWW